MSNLIPFINLHLNGLIVGIGRLADISGSYNLMWRNSFLERHHLRQKRTDYDALKSDWLKVGGDIRYSLDRHSQEYEQKYFK